MRSFARWTSGSLLAAVLFIGLLVINCGESSQQAPPARPAPEVVTLTIQPQHVVLTTELPGRTTAFRVAEIRPQVNGLILKRYFTEGSDVSAGELLYQIDPASFQSALENAKAALGRTEANLPAIEARAKRYHKLLSDNAVSQQAYEDADAALRQAQADILYWRATVESARINLSYTRMTAPISGRIGRSNVTEGAIVTAYQPMALATIQQLDPIHVDVNQSTTELLRLKRRMADGHIDKESGDQKQVKLILEDGTEYPYPGTLKFRDVTVETTTGSVTLRMVFPNSQGMLLPGMFVRAVITEGSNNQAIMIPQQAVSRDPKGNPIVLIVDSESKIQQKLLILDRAIGDQWLVTAGLAPGDRIVTEGLQKVRAGMPVKVRSAAPAESPAGTPSNGTASAAPQSN